MPLHALVPGSKRILGIVRSLWLSASITATALPLSSWPSVAHADEHACAALVHRHPGEEHPRPTKRLKQAGVVFTREPVQMGPIMIAVFATRAAT